jgi:hypothetical protein
MTTSSVRGPLSRSAALGGLALCGLATCLYSGALPERALGQNRTPASRAARDWQKDPAIVELNTSEDVYALGDVHGDYDRLVALLAAARVIPAAPDHPRQVQWGVGRAVLVCTGDLIDKGDHSVKVISLMRALQAAAQKAGGRVIVTMGNHEAEFLGGPRNHKAKEFRRELDRRKVGPEDVAAGRDAEGIGAFLRALPLAARVNDWFFTHAGDTRGRNLKQLRAELQEGVDAHGFDVSVPALASLLEARLHDRPWWEMERDPAKEREPAAASTARLAGYVRALGVRHLVIGHQPGHVIFADGSRRKKGQMCQEFDGLLFLIDVGMSRGIDDGGRGYSEGALLRIQGARKATALFPNGTQELLWKARPGQARALVPETGGVLRVTDRADAGSWDGYLGRRPATTAR